ncbi:MAG: bifunctional oligoribonuclease/PAP phosphatase NrnA [Planctomycetota bacterium]|nr:MAG: bifunctional oligoribonuclease/PAP phosphatase NrnA [Planctomycetota bacterium]
MVEISGAIIWESIEEKKGEMMLKEKYHQILEKLSSFYSFLLVTHPNPDGDALGSSLAIYHLLKEANKEVQLVYDGFLDPKLSFLLENVNYSHLSQFEFSEVEALIAFDIGDKKRIQKAIDGVKDFHPFVINIDHHASNRGFGDIDLIAPWASSTGEIVYHLLRTGEIFIHSCTATALYTAIATDTGFFTFSNTTPSSLKSASELLEMGAELAKITEHIVRSKSYALFQLEREYLNSLQFSPNHHIVWGVVPREMVEKYQVPLAQVGDFVEIPRNIDTIAISALFRDEDTPGKVKISLRSNDNELDMNRFANSFGGGGHARAAGAVVEGSLEEVVEKIIHHLFEYYEKIKKEAP